MSATTETTESYDDKDMLAALGRSWGLLLFLGVLTLLLGLGMVIFTKQSLVVLAVLFGVYLLISGIFQIVQSFSQKDHRALLAISGILSVVLAIFAFKSFLNSVTLLAIFIGIAWLFRGITELIVGLQSKGAEGRGWMITGGILGILGAIVIFVWPATIGVIVWITGIMLIVLGVSEIVGAFTGIGKEGKSSFGLTQKDVGAVGFGSSNFMQSILGKATRAAMENWADNVCRALDAGTLKLIPRGMHPVGKVILVEGDIVTSNTGEAKGYCAGEKVEIHRPGKTLTDPDTGEVLNLVPADLGSQAWNPLTGRSGTDRVPIGIIVTNGNSQLVGMTFVGDDLFALTEDGQVDVVGKGLGVERTVPADDDQRVLGPATSGVDRNASQIHHVQHIGVDQLGRQVEGQQVEVARGAVSVHREQRNSTVAKQGLEVAPGRVRALGDRVVAFVQDFVEDLQPLVGQADFVRVGVGEQPGHLVR